MLPVKWPRLWLSWLAVLCALAGCSRPVSADPKAAAEGLYLAATSAYLEGRLPEARAGFEKVRQVSPDDPRLLAALGEVALAEGKTSEALAAFQQATTRDPQRATNWSRLGGLFAAKGQRREAGTALRRALALNPADSNAHEQLAGVSLEEGALDEAMAGYLQAAQTAPTAQQDAILLRAVEALRRHQHPAQARTLLERAAAQGPRGSELWAELGDVRVRAGQLSEGRQAYEAAARAGKTDPSLWEIVGELDRKLDRPADAEAAFRESLRIEDRAVVHVALARLHLARQDARSAQRELDLALQKATGKEARESDELAQLLEQLGRPRDALALLRALAEDPSTHPDGALWRRIARLARSVGDKAGAAFACARAADAGVERCGE